MKVKITIELDLTNNPSLNIPTIEAMPGSIQNLTSLLNDLHLDRLEKTIKAMAKQNIDQLTKDALIEAYKADQDTTAQLFDNITIEGITDDGHTFTFNHQEPGYKETTTIDGKTEYNYNWQQ